MIYADVKDGNVLLCKKCGGKYIKDGICILCGSTVLIEEHKTIKRCGGCGRVVVENGFVCDDCKYAISAGVKCVKINIERYEKLDDRSAGFCPAAEAIRLMLMGELCKIKNREYMKQYLSDPKKKQRVLEQKRISERKRYAARKRNKLAEKNRNT